MIKDPLAFRRELEKANDFWLTGRVKEAERFPKKREEFKELVEEIGLKHIILVTGPRRVGKTVLLKHLIDNLLKTGINPRNILFYSFDSPTLSLFCDNPLIDAFEYWYENIAEEGRKYFFVDEAHFVKDWYKWIKLIYDRYDDVKIFVSGSSSISIQKDANTFLKGRTIFHEIFPLTFKEFLMLKGRKVEDVDIQKIDTLEVEKIVKKFENDFKEYLLVGGFPEWFEVKDKDRWFKILVNMIPKRAIYEDISTIFKIRNTKILETILSFVVANQGKILAYETINEVANLKHEILVNYLEYLKSSYLVVEILKFAKIKEQLKAKKKYLCIDQGLRNAILSEYEVKEDNIGFIVENVVGLHLWYEAKKRRGKLSYYKVNDEIDFILSGKTLIPVEIKFREIIKEKDIKPIKNFIEKYNTKKAFVLTKTIYEVEELGTAKILFVPVIFFLLHTSRFLI